MRKAGKDAQEVTDDWFFANTIRLTSICPNLKIFTNRKVLLHSSLYRNRLLCHRDLLS